LSRIPQNDYGVPAEFLVETIPQEAPADDEQSECNATALHPTPTSGTQVRGINSAYVARFVSIQQQLPRIPFAQSCVVLGRVCCCVTPDVSAYVPDCSKRCCSDFTHLSGDRALHLDGNEVVAFGCLPTDRCACRGVKMLGFAENSQAMTSSSARM
jgi:hypothetical protein